MDIAQTTSTGVREDTAELASLALSDIASIRSGRSPSRQYASSSILSGVDDQASTRGSRVRHRASNESSRPEAIHEVSEPVTPEDGWSSRRATSALTALIRQSPREREESADEYESDFAEYSTYGPVTVREAIISQPSEETTVLLRRAASYKTPIPRYGATNDLENQGPARGAFTHKLRESLAGKKDSAFTWVRKVQNPKSWDLRQVWVLAIKRPAGYIPPVILGLLLNLLDALSYGMSIERNQKILSTLTLPGRHDTVSSR